MTPSDIVESFLRTHDLPFARTAIGSFAFSISGEHKRSMPVTLTLGESRLSIEAFFVRRPLDNAAEVYRMVLSRNLRPGPVRFAADADGDLYIVGEVALDGIGEQTLDLLLGATLSLADEMFDHALEIGFGSYLERDRAYRASHRDG